MSEKITLEINRDESGTFFVSAPNLSGVLGTGRTADVAMKKFVLGLVIYFIELSETPIEKLGDNIKAERSYLMGIFDMRPAPKNSFLRSGQKALRKGRGN